MSQNDDSARPRFPALVASRASMVRLCIGVGMLLHFALILTEVTHLRQWLEQANAGQTWRVVSEYYSALTFANRNFGFFAPDVTPDWNLAAAVAYGDGSSRPVKLPTPTREMAVKHYSMMGHFSENDATMDLFARSWALYLLRRDPRARSAELVVTRNFLPSMQEYRAGGRVRQQPFYRTEYARGGCHDRP
jgi:hypothetical protein